MHAENVTAGLEQEIRETIAEFAAELETNG